MSNTNDKAIAVINGQNIVVPQEIANICNDKGNRMTAREYLQRTNKLAVNPKQKLTDLKKQIGDAAKGQIKTYNQAKVMRRKFSRFVVGHVLADQLMQHDVKFKFGAKGNWLGVDTASRFTKATPDVVEALQDKIAELEAKLAAKPAQAAIAA